ncbi:uncharacterized protein METZ01_LOCUS52413 [marine metagenome]|uniref:DUF3500 domain-containing protein n=1 Tax=marine metagenome TaxID=408172 RepID=A0A381S7T5_9ZZZZ
MIGFVLVGKAVQQSRVDLQERFRRMSDEYEAEGLAEKYTGVTTHGAPAEGLFGIHSTGVSTEPIQRAAKDFLGSLTSEQVAKTVFPVDDPEWRKWMNQHFYIRQGMGFDEMQEVQRNAAFGLLRESLSARGLKLTRDIMKLNHTLGELNGDNFVEYGEWLYWITVMGEPSSTEPWGWQLDGHHAIINYFVLGDQVVMTPFFVGSEPVIAETGKYMGTSILQVEQNRGLAMLRALSEVQQEQAVIQVSKTGNDNLGEAFKDNIVLDYAGVSVASWSDTQKDQLLELIELYIGNLRDSHARVRMEEVTAHLNDTFFAWIGGTDDEAVFYYRIHSPVILIEFDHQQPAGLRHLFSSDLPIRQHVHAVIRTPNGNDYGKDLLRQHYKAHPHTP